MLESLEYFTLLLGIPVARLVRDGIITHWQSYSLKTKKTVIVASDNSMLHILEFWAWDVILSNWQFMFHCTWNLVFLWQTENILMYLPWFVLVEWESKHLPRNRPHICLVTNVPLPPNFSKASQSRWKSGDLNSALVLPGPSPWFRKRHEEHMLKWFFYLPGRKLGGIRNTLTSAFCWFPLMASFF